MDRHSKDHHVIRQSGIEKHAKRNQVFWNLWSMHVETLNKKVCVCVLFEFELFNCSHCRPGAPQRRLSSFSGSHVPVEISGGECTVSVCVCVCMCVCVCVCVSVFV